MVENINNVKNINTITLLNNTYSGNTELENIDLAYVPWKDNSMQESFIRCSNLVSVTNINGNVLNMREAYAFCTNLKNAPAIPSGVTETWRIFQNCTSLTDASEIPSSVTGMYNTFENCISLVNAPNIPNSVTNMSMTFINCYSLENAPEIPDSVINMHGVFSHCNKLTDAPNIPNSVTDMPWIFHDCTNLINVPEIPNSVRIMQSTFHGCTSLTGDIYINSENVVHATDCFEGTSLEKNVYIPFKYDNGVYTSTYNSFISAGYPIAEPRVNGVLLKNLNYDPFDEWRYERLQNGTNLLYEYIGMNTYITVPNDRTIINNYTSGEKTTTESNTPFFENQDVEYAELANVPWVNNSMAYAFYNDQNVRGIYNINTDVVNYFKAFWNCTNLTEITLPGSFFDEGNDVTGAFEDCGNLRNITIVGNVGNITNISNTFNGTGISVTPTLPNTIEDLAWAFANCFFLTNTGPIPTSAKNMQGTFYNCYNIIGAMDIHAPNLSDMSWTYWNCTNLVNVGSIPNNVSNMYQTYYNCSNMNMIPTIPTNVSNMAETFYNCQSITNIPEIHNKVTNMYGTFDGCISITGSIDIYSENIINVDNIFNNTSSLKDVYIPFTYDNGVNTSTYNAFINAGYTTDPSNRVNGVLLHNYLNAFNFSDWETTRDENNNVRLTKYIGDRVNIIVPYLS